PSDRDNPLRAVAMVPIPSDVGTFAERFDVSVCTAYNSTEISSPISSQGFFRHMPAGAAGRLRDGYDCEIVDEHDYPVAPGAVGELVVRSGAPWTLMSGYLDMPEATSAAWRNGFFHTGDAFRRDDDGWYYFVDRRQDVIRRRGE